MSTLLDELKKELLAEQISEAIRSDSTHWREGLEELGFEWHDDEADITDDAPPANAAQQRIIDHLEGNSPFDASLVELLINEVEQSETPLFIRYFSCANNNLLQLLLSGLERHPTSDLLLSGLALFHEHRPILSQLISAYLNGCLLEEDRLQLKERAITFIIETEPDGFDAATALQALFQENREKLATIQAAITEIDRSNNNHECIKI